MKLMSVFCLALMIFVGACAMQSYHPFCSDEDVVDIPELYGKWKLLNLYDENVVEKRINDWEISAGRLLCFDEKNIESELKLRLFKIGDTIFANLTAGEITEDRRAMNLYWILTVIPVNVVAKIVLSDDHLLMIPADYEAVKKKIDDGSLKLDHLRRGNNEIFFIAKTTDMKNFLSENKDNVEIFSPQKAFLLKRVEQQNNEGK